MSDAFDEEAFLRRSCDVVVHSIDKSFADLEAEVEALRQEMKRAGDRPANRFIDRELDRRLFVFAISTSQAPSVVDRLYRQSVKRGFNDLHAEVYSAIEYAYFWKEQKNLTKGKRALSKVRAKVSARARMPPEIKQGFLDAIEAPIRRLQK